MLLVMLALSAHSVLGKPLTVYTVSSSSILYWSCSELLQRTSESAEKKVLAHRTFPRLAREHPSSTSLPPFHVPFASFSKITPSTSASITSNETSTRLAAYAGPLWTRQVPQLTTTTVRCYLTTVARRFQPSLLLLLLTFLRSIQQQRTSSEHIPNDLEEQQGLGSPRYRAEIPTISA